MEKARKGCVKGQEGQKISTKGHEGRQRATKGLAEDPEGSAKGREGGPRRALRKKISTKGHEEPRRATKGLAKRRSRRGPNHSTKDREDGKRVIHEGRDSKGLEKAREGCVKGHEGQKISTKGHEGPRSWHEDSPLEGSPAAAGRHCPITPPLRGSRRSGGTSICQSLPP